MNPNLKIWECAQRLIELRYEGLDCGYDDTSDVYDWLIEDIHPNQIDNFYEMVCRDAHPVNVNDCYVDANYNVYRVILCDLEQDKIEIRVNGSQFIYRQKVDEGADYILTGFKLIKLEEYYEYLDIIWETKSGLFMDEKSIERVDLSPSS